MDAVLSSLLLRRCDLRRYVSVAISVASVSLGGWLVASLSGCQVDVPEGVFSCVTDSDCPPRLVCSGNGLCIARERDGGAPEHDAGIWVCTVPTECDDGRFCNGAERCDPTEATASVTGCVPALDVTPCGLGTCSETTNECLTSCQVDDDLDHDGHARRACGGDDCDDTRAGAYPGFVEACDTVDDDCDPLTVGSTDADGDGSVSRRCCNPDGSGGARCGPDCDDDRMSVRPGATETCNGLDDDCDGSVDENVRLTLYPDGDGDGYGVTAGMTSGCTAIGGYAIRAGDCAPSDPARHPSATEVCNGLDDDCVGGVDDGIMCSCTNGATRACGVETGACNPGMQSCASGAWLACGGTYIGPVAETCNAVDDDCDGTVDDGAATSCPLRPHASPLCVSGACTVVCDAGYLDCSAVNPTDGCEVSALTDPEHCGGCGPCATPSQVATRACTAGACQVGNCATGFGDCNRTFTDGCEVATTTSVMHCGACNAACPVRPSTTVACLASNCVYTCVAGSLNCNETWNDGCERVALTCPAKKASASVE